MQHNRRLLIRFSIAAGTLLAAGGVWLVIDGILSSLRAERCLHANLQAIRLVTRYVENRGAWPRNWDELQRECLGTDDVTSMREYVFIDFGADIDRLAEATNDEFEAVRPLGECYPYQHYREVDELLVALRRIVRDGPGMATDASD